MPRTSPARSSSSTGPAALGGDAGQVQHGGGGGAGRPGAGRAVALRLAADDVVHDPVRAVVGQEALADEVAVAQDGEAVGHLVDLVEAVADVDDGVAAVAQGVQDVEEPGAVGGGEAGGRFVEDDEAGAGGQCAGDGDEGAFGAGEVRDGRVRVEVKPATISRASVQQPAYLPPGDEPGAAGVTGAEGDVLGHRHPLHEAEVLVDEGHLGGRGAGAERVAGDSDLALVGAIDTGKDLDKCGFSRTVVTQ